MAASSLREKLLAELYPALPDRAPNQRFENIKHRLEEEGVKDDRETHIKLKQYLPDKKDQAEYYAWCAGPLRQQIEAKKESWCPDGTTVKKLLQDLNYTDTQSMWDLDLLYRLDYLPVILVGRSRGILFDVLLTPVLCASRQIKGNEKRVVLLGSILGINSNVEPIKQSEQQPPSPSRSRRRRRSEFRSEESNDSAESDDYDPNNFHIMYQIGALRAYMGKATSDKDKIADKKSWRDTGFALVTDVTTGTARGVWIVYNFYPKDADGDRYHLDDDDEWGWLPGYEGIDDRQFSVAKIADRLSQLGSGFNFGLSNQIPHEPELVRVVKDFYGRLQKQSVEKEKSQWSAPKA
ncbi:MAG: hypothetical protein Q9170_001796 [Blastenia crenularia]